MLSGCHVNVSRAGVTMRCMARCLFSISLCAAIALVSCSPPTSSQKTVGARTSRLKNHITPADPSKYRSVVDARHWQNPYLMVRANGIDARPISPATESPKMAPTEVVAYLEKLPSIAWPYGLVVAVSENGLRAPGDDGPNQKKQRRIGTPSRGGWGEGGIVALGVVVRSVRSARYEIA